MSELQLFPDSETFTKHRPTKLSTEQEETFWLKMANEVIDGGWSDDDPRLIAEDLEELYLHDSGFDKAKSLERGNADYTFQGEFISWLDDLWYSKREAIQENVKLWVKAHNPQPKFSKGQCLQVKEYINHELKAGQTIYITGIREETASYLAWPEQDHNGGYILDYEEVEAKCISND